MAYTLSSITYKVVSFDHLLSMIFFMPKNMIAPPANIYKKTQKETKKLDAYQLGFANLCTRQADRRGK